MKYNLNQAKSLFYAYSPVKTNKQLTNHYSDIMHSITDSSDSIRSLYNNVIFKEFLNETVIKSTFIEKFSFTKSPQDTITVFEMNVGQSRADICLLNGTSIVYEIKTEYDTFNRLDAQLSDYRKSFELVNIIIPVSRLSDALPNLDHQIGIVTYTQLKNKNIRFNVYRKPKHHDFIEPKFQLEQLTKLQLSKLTTSTNLEKEEMILELLTLHTDKEINQLYINAMKLKYKKRWTFLYKHKDQIKPLDYQWFFKNNIKTELIYR